MERVKGTELTRANQLIFLAYPIRRVIRNGPRDDTPYRDLDPRGWPSRPNSAFGTLTPKLSGRALMAGLGGGEVWSFQP